MSSLPTPPRAEPAFTPRRIALYAAVLLIAFTAWHLRELLLVVFAAVLVATLLVALADVFEKYTPLGRGVAVLAAVLVVIGVVIGGGVLIGTQLAGQMQDLTQRIPEAWSRIEAWIVRFDVDFSASELLDEARPSTSMVAAHVGSAASLTVGALVNVAIVLVGAIYFASQPQLYRRGLVALAPPHRREAIGRGVDALGLALRKWLMMQLAVMAMIGTATGLAMWALGVPSPLALGVIAGLLEFVPIAGPLLAAVPAILVAFSVSPELALWVAGAFVVIQQLEGYVVTPLMARQAVEIPPAVMLFALVGFASLFGLAGGLLAAPLMVVAYVAVREFYVGTLLEHRPVPATPDST